MQLAMLAAGNAEYQRVKGELELKSHSLKLLQERSEKSESHQLAEAVTAMETDLTIAQVINTGFRVTEGSRVETGYGTTV